MCMKLYDGIWMHKKGYGCIRPQTDVYGSLGWYMNVNGS